VARRRKKSSKRYLPLVAVPYDVKPDARVEMLKRIEPKMLENPVSATVDMSLMANAAVMMTGRRVR
jgi:hypothetical protein